MNAQVALQNYANVKVNAAIESATPHQLISMLYDGLLERISQAKGATEQKNVELKGIKVNQAISILSGLRESLDDKSVESELPTNLDALYDYVQRRIWKAHSSNDESIFDECYQLINELNLAWKAIA